MQTDCEGSKADREFQFVLSELERESALIDKRYGRIEQVIAFYIAILTALIAASALAVTRSSGNELAFILLVACVVAAATGHIAYFALVVVISQTAFAHSRFYARRQYFLDEFPDTIRYVAPLSDFAQMSEVWKVYFSRATIIFLHSFAIFNGILLAISGAGMMLAILNLIGTIEEDIEVILSISVGLILIVLSIYVQNKYLGRHMINAKNHSYLLIDCIKTERASSTETFTKSEEVEEESGKNDMDY